MKTRISLMLIACLFHSSISASAENNANYEDEYVNAVHDLRVEIVTINLKLEACAQFAPESVLDNEAAFRIWMSRNQATIDLFLEHDSLARNVHYAGNPEKKRAVIAQYNKDYVSYREAFIKDLSSVTANDALNRCKGLSTFFESQDSNLEVKYAKQIKVINSVLFSTPPPP